MHIPEKTEFITLICRVERFSKSGIPIYNTEVPTFHERLSQKKKKMVISYKAYALQTNTMKDLSKVMISTIQLF